MHPVFCARFPSYVNSIENAALSLIWVICNLCGLRRSICTSKTYIFSQPLKQIQSEGPFTIVGETWSGTIAVEFAKIIEGFGDTVNLVLLDGCPSDNDKRLKLLENFDFESLGKNSEKKVTYFTTFDVSH